MGVLVRATSLFLLRDCWHRSNGKKWCRMIAVATDTDHVGVGDPSTASASWIGDLLLVLLPLSKEKASHAHLM